jgi:transcriptional regulator with XRE-family HTH domain
MAVIRGGELLAKGRKFQEMTQKEVSVIYGVCDRQLSRWENGKNEPPYDDVRAIFKDVYKIDYLKFVNMVEGSSKVSL